MSGGETEARRILINSSVWIDVFRGLTTAETPMVEQAPTQDLLTADLVLCEVLRGCRTEQEFDATLWRLTDFEVVTISGPDLAIQAAINYRTRGITVRGTIDALIATWCIENECWLLHSDRDFDPFEEHLGLKVVR